MEHCDFITVISLKALIAYGTRYGATAQTSEEIGKILQQESFEVKITNLKTEKINDISSYDLIVVGSGLQIGKWVGEAEDFLKKFQKELENKKVAIFVSTMSPVSAREGKIEDIQKSRKMTLDDKVAKYNLKPISSGFFGGVIDFNKMGFLTRKTFGWIKPQLEKDGFKESPPGVYDLRDWDEIRNWAKDLAKKAQFN